VPEGKRRKAFLVIEDSADDAVLIRRAFDSIEGCHAVICRNISEAKAYVQGAGMYQDRTEFPFPNAVICDLWLGGESGNEFLQWLKRTNFRALPVYVLSGCNSPKDFLAAKKLGAVDILKKPADLGDLQRMLTDVASKLCA
jgi:CheY-like chemotaxis protein